MKKLLLLIALLVLLAFAVGFRVRSFVGKQDRQTYQFDGTILSLRDDSLWVEGKINGKRIYKFYIDMFTSIKGNIEAGDDVTVFYYIKEVFRDTIKVAKKIVLLKKGVHRPDKSYEKNADDFVD